MGDRVFCPDCDEMVREFWPEPKQRECPECGGIVFDDRETREKVIRQSSPRFVDEREVDAETQQEESA